MFWTVECLHQSIQGNLRCFREGSLTFLSKKRQKAPDEMECFPEKQEAGSGRGHVYGCILADEWWQRRSGAGAGGAHARRFIKSAIKIYCLFIFAWLCSSAETKETCWILGSGGFGLREESEEMKQSQTARCWCVCDSVKERYHLRNRCRRRGLDWAKKKEMKNKKITKKKKRKGQLWLRTVDPVARKTRRTTVFRLHWSRRRERKRLITKKTFMCWRRVSLILMIYREKVNRETRVSEANKQNWLLGTNSRLGNWNLIENLGHGGRNSDSK